MVAALASRSREEFTVGPESDHFSDFIGLVEDHFGSGGQANRRVLMSQEVVRSLVAENVRGASLRPVQSGNGKP